MDQQSKTNNGETGVLNSTLSQDADSIQKSLDLSGLVGDAPSVVPGYRILKPIGEGKYGSVWLAREQNTGKHVAIKFYTHRRGVDWSLLGREVEKLAVLYTSRNIVGLLAVGWDHDPPYYVMEYLENGSLAARLAQGPLTAADAVRIATRICQALVHAHGSGILHCDLKPANILLDQDVEPRLCDFGQSRLADEHSHSLGTLFYMAPEQADLKAVPDARWDVYALGALIYNMLTGVPPFRTNETERRLSEARSLEDRLTVYRQIVRSGPKPSMHRRVSGVDQQLAEIVDRCLAADPARRFPSTQAVLDRLMARERFRARRPLILLGLILPLLLLFCIVPLAIETMNDAVNTTQENLTRRALESDVLSVNLLADSIDRELEDRRHELETLAADKDLRLAVAEYATKPANERQPLFEQLEGLKRKNDERLKELGRLLDASWILLDSSGIQRWRDPLGPKPEQNLAWRDFYHGGGFDWPEDDISPDNHAIRNFWISIPFKSSTTELYVVALSVPIFDPKAGEDVIGVLCRTVTLGNLIKDYQRNWQSKEVDGVNRKLAIVERRELDEKHYWQLLAHSWMDDSKLEQIPEADFKKLRLEGIVDKDVIQNLELLMRQSKKGDDAATQQEIDFDRTRRYIDPVRQFDPDTYGGEWLAAFSRVGKTKWVAVVQERKDAALRPVEELQRRMLTSAFGGVLVVFSLVAGSWWLIVALLSERAPRWLKFWRTQSASPGTTTMSLTGKGADTPKTAITWLKPGQFGISTLRGLRHLVAWQLDDANDAADLRNSQSAIEVCLKSLTVQVQRSVGTRRVAQVARPNRRSKCHTPGMLTSPDAPLRMATYFDNGKEHCMTHGNHDQFRLGFLTAVEDAERGFVGGLLITNRFGRPLEFQCTAPVKPNRTQQILYGPTLKPYVLGELIGRTLLEKVGVKPHIVLVESADLLELRSATSTPVACLLSLGDAPPHSLPDSQNLQNGHISSGHLRLGNEMVFLSKSHEGDRNDIEKFAKLIPGDADLREPFERIREALVETIRLSMARPA